ncbi:uncharacterized protein DC041_0006993, partial [Schistosoma bovis]
LLPVISWADQIVIRTNYGAVSGKQKYIHGKNVFQFLGIPFAKPPIGDLRFRFPEPPDPWSNILDATKPPNTCMQPLPESHKLYVFRSSPVLQYNVTHKVKLGSRLCCLNIVITTCFQIHADDGNSQGFYT